MLKKISLFVLVFTIIGFGIRNTFSSRIKMDWGNYFTFQNDLDIIVDSLEISVGHVKTMIISDLDSDSLISLGGNLNVPEKGYPHKVAFKIYSGPHLLKLEADSFDCHNCDGDHEYRLTKSGAKYSFHH